MFKGNIKERLKNFWAGLKSGCLTNHYFEGKSLSLRLEDLRAD